jgi:hypothetical protein
MKKIINPIMKKIINPIMKIKNIFENFKNNKNIIFGKIRVWYMGMYDC